MSWLTRLTNALSPWRLDQELADEIRDHLERRAADLHAGGLDPAEAHREAMRVFGNVTRYREQSRELRLWAALEGTVQDARYAWRGLRRNPMFAFTAVVSLGLAIGANTAIYSVIDAAMLRPLPVADADALFTLATSAGNQPGVPASDDAGAFSFPLYEELRAAAGDLARVALIDSPNRVEAQFVSGDAPREDVIQQFVSPDAFDILGVPPAAGRLFSPTEDRYPVSRRVVVLSYEYWRRRFGADPSVLGKSFSANGGTYAILGVTREGFYGAEAGKFVDMWLPIAVTDPGIFTNPEFKSFRLIGRLAPHATRDQLVARLQPAFHNHQVARIGSGPTRPLALQQQLREMRIVARSGASGLSAFGRMYARPLWLLLTVAGCILLIASANVASLLLARSTARSGEMALRVSLGAGRVRLVRQLLTESMLIAALSGLGGWLLARAAAPALVAMVSKRTDPVRLDFALDTRVLLFCVAICALSALFCGVLPAREALGGAHMSALRHSSGMAGRLRLGRFFVGVQVAFAFCLVAGGTGFLFSLRNLTTVDTGFDTKGVTVLRMSTTLGAQQRGQQLALMQQMQLRAAALPTVHGAATAWMPVFSGGRRAQRIVLPGKSPSDVSETFYRVSPGYLGTLRIPLLGGRDLEFRDNDDEPVPTLVNRAFARKYFGRESALGLEFRRDDGVRHQIVGIAGDSHYSDLRIGSEPIVYMPMKPTAGFTLYVHSPLDAGSVAAMVQREATALGSGLRVRDVTSLEALVGSTILTDRLLASIGGAFACLGLLLAAIGLFGLLNYSVTRRTKELGIRAALGAQPLALCVLVLKDLSRTTVLGLAVGLAGSLVLMRFAASLLFGIQTADPFVIGTAMAVFIGVAAIAGGFPAWRAASLDVVLALRND